LFQAAAVNRAFDIPFYLLECAGAVFFVFAVAKPAVISYVAVRWASILLILALPAAWIVLFPQTIGIEGATRLLLAVPLVTTNIMLAFAAYLKTRRR
jgi:hypothetical protein